VKNINFAINPLLTVLLLLSFYSDSIAWDYGEHKEIGDKAFNSFSSWVINEKYFKEEREFLEFFRKAIGLEYSYTEKTYYFKQLSAKDNIITYGALNGLSGDHEQNPLALEEDLMYTRSTLNQIIALHNEYIKKFGTGAPSTEIMHYDIKFAWFAAVDLSHFYEYGVSYDDQLNDFEKEHLIKLLKPDYVEQVFSDLKKTNSLCKYVTLHSMAVYLAEIAGNTMAKDSLEAYKYLYYAFLYNAFADHFLEDSFSSGHLVVNRSIFTALINNRALHDFYCENGMEVINLNGEKWKQYGDRNFNKYHSEWEDKSSYLQIEYPPLTKNSERIIDAVTLSVSEVFQAFRTSMEEPNRKKIIERMPSGKILYYKFFIENFKALSLVPVPFGTDLLYYNVKSKNKKELQKTVESIPYRNYIRSRVANSLLVGLGGNFTKNSKGEYTSIIELRFNLGTNFYSFNYNYELEKKGTMDSWFGPTVSFQIGNTEMFKKKNDYTALKLGVNSIYDIWLSESRFFSVYDYLETGIQWDNGIARAVFTPSVGLQFGSLIGIKYYELPIWIRIPLELLLPLKLRFGADYVPTKKPDYHLIGEIDILF